MFSKDFIIRQVIEELRNNKELREELKQILEIKK